MALVGAATLMFGCESERPGSSSAIPFFADGPKGPAVYIVTTKEARGAPHASPIRSDPARATVTPASGPSSYRVRCKGIESARAEQATVAWCWAACAVTLLHQQGTKVTQEQLVNYFGDRLANHEVVYWAICWGTDAAMHAELAVKAAQRDPGHVAKLVLPKHTMTSDQMVERLSLGLPLVVGLKGADGSATGHMCVVAGATYRVLDPALGTRFTDPATGSLTGVYAKTAIESFWLLDPLPYADARGTVMDAEEFRTRAVFVTTPDLATESIRAGLQNQDQDSKAMGRGYRGYR